MKSRQRLLLEILWIAGWLDSVVAIRNALARLKKDVSVWAERRAFPALAAIAGLDSVAGLVLGRRFNGGPPLYITNARLVIGAVAATVMAIAGRWWLSRIEREPPARWLRILLTALCVLPILALLSLANSQHSPWAVSIASALAVATGAAVLLWDRVALISSTPVSISIPSLAVRAPLLTPIGQAGAETKYCVQELPLTKSREIHAADSDEWMKRKRSDSGLVTVDGQAIAEFSAGQSVLSVHIPFCPTFSRIPEFSYEIMNEPSVLARKPAVYRYGARLELKRTGDTSHSARVEIRFRATASDANSTRAA
jgi:hypothetical protein